MRNYLAGLLVVLGSLSPAALAGAEPPEVAAYNAASALVREGKLQQAVPQLERAIEIRPSYSAPYFALGEIYGKRGLPSQGMLYYMRFVSLEPDGERSAAAAKSRRIRSRSQRSASLAKARWAGSRTALADTAGSQSWA